MKAGDKFYQIVSPMKPMMLSGKADARETEDCIIIDGKLRKIGQWYPEEHTVEEIYLKENIVMDEDCHSASRPCSFWISYNARLIPSAYAVCIACNALPEPSFPAFARYSSISFNRFFFVASLLRSCFFSAFSSAACDNASS